MLLEGIETDAEYALVLSYGGYTTNLPLRDLLDGKAWFAFGYDGADLTPEHGGPARLLVPHLYLWKSAKWVRGIDLRRTNERGFWEQLGYHDYGDPWLEQRYSATELAGRRPWSRSRRDGGGPHACVRVARLAGTPGGPARRRPAHCA